MQMNRRHLRVKSSKRGNASGSFVVADPGGLIYTAHSWRPEALSSKGLSRPHSDRDVWLIATCSRCGAEHREPRYASGVRCNRCGHWVLV